MNKPFEAIYALSMVFHAMGHCSSLSDAGQEAIKRSCLEGCNVGRKWAVSTQPGRWIISAGKHGWVGLSEYGDIGISDTYLSQFYRENDHRIKDLIPKAILLGYPMILVVEMLDAAIGVERSVPLERLLSGLEEAFE